MMKLNLARDVSLCLPQPSKSVFESCISTQKLLNQRNQISKRTYEIFLIPNKKLQCSSTYTEKNTKKKKKVAEGAARVKYDFSFSFSSYLPFLSSP